MAWKSCLLNPNNTAFQIPSSLSKSLAVIRSSLVLSRDFSTAAGSQEMQWLLSATALAWLSPAAEAVCLLRSSPAPSAVWLPPLDILAVSGIAEVQTAGWLLHPSRILGSDRWFWRLSQATYCFFCEDCPPEKRAIPLELESYSPRADCCQIIK